LAREIEITYITGSESGENNERILEILSDGVYTYLRDNGLLKDELNQADEVKTILEKTK